MSNFSRDNYRVESLTPPDRYAGQVSEPSWRESRRARLFALVFGVTLTIGLVWALLQPNVYRSSATVLMSAPSAIDDVVSEANLQNVAIQRRLLLGSEITRQVQVQLAQSEAAVVEPGDLSDRLLVEPVAGTNLVEMAAQGPDGEILPMLVNLWIDVYLAIRAADIEQSKEHTLAVVQGELDGLAVKLDEARDSLERYREANDIISAERQENEVLARLDGLNKALNNAIEEEVKTGAYLNTLQMAIRRGDTIVPQEERRAMESLEAELRQLEGELAELSKRYTTGYINKQPQLRVIPERIEELKSELARALSLGRDTELAAAQHAHAAASQAMDDLQGKLEEHRQHVSDFSRIYATHEALVDDLGSLEALNREAQARLVQVQVRQVEKYPQVTVIERPGPESKRTGPDYLLLVAAVLAGALVSGIITVWLHGFLGPQKNESPPQVTLSGVHLYPQEVSGQIAYSSEPDPRLERPASNLLADERLNEVKDTDDEGESTGPDHVDRSS